MKRCVRSAGIVLSSLLLGVQQIMEVSKWLSNTRSENYQVRNEHLLSPDEEDMIALSYWVVNQSDNLPEQMVKRHGMIFDFYLEACPVQVYGIIDLISNFGEGEYD